MKNPDEFKDEKVQLTEAEHYRASAEAYKQELKSSWKIFWGTGAFVLAALSVLFILCFAWFVMNNQVNSGTGTVSAQQDIIRIASKGERQTAEKLSPLQLDDGSEYEYNGDKYYYTEGGEIAWRLAEDYSVMPGANGSIDFYIIPNHDGAQTITLYMGLAGYKKGKDAEDKEIVEPVEDEALNALLNGHILLFNKKDKDNGFYSDWLFNDKEGGIINNTIKIVIPPEWKKDEPYPCTVYWIWPKRYENMVSHRLDSNDVFAEDSNEFGKFQDFINTQSGESKQIGTTSYRYSYIFVWNEWPLPENARSKAYNLADEYIGTNADYLYLTIRTTSQVEIGTGEGGNGE